MPAGLGRDQLPDPGAALPSLVNVISRFFGPQLPGLGGAGCGGGGSCPLRFSLAFELTRIWHFPANWLVVYERQTPSLAWPTVAITPGLFVVRQSGDR